MFGLIPRRLRRESDHYALVDGIPFHLPVASQRSRDIGRPLTRSSLAVISETTSPAPRAAANRLNGASVTPDMGARRTRLATAMSPIFNGLERDDAEPVTVFSF